MEEQNGLSFNCAESVILQVNRTHPLPDFEAPCLRIASMLGGGVSGFGSVCGAVSGGIMCLGLKLGTDGHEAPDAFTDKRRHARSIAQKFMQAFEAGWGSTQCKLLKEMDEGVRSPSGSFRVNDSDHRSRCEDYVSWTSKTILELLREI